MNQAFDELRDAIISYDGAKVDNILAEIKDSVTPETLFSNSICPALDSLCCSIQQKRGAVPELLLGLRLVHHITESGFTAGAAPRGRVVIGVIDGDIHDMGKNVIRDVCKGYGYEVTDLGKSVSPQAFVDKAVEQNADVACLSTMMSTTIDNMKETITQLKTRLPEIRIVVGGAFIDQGLADQLQADGYARDASTVMAEFSRILQ